MYATRTMVINIKFKTTITNLLLLLLLLFKTSM